MDTLDQYRVFMQVADMGSFIRAAKTLNLPRATVSAAVQQLEAAVGTRLLHRTTRQVGLTPDGELLLARVRALLVEAEEIEQLFHAQQRQVSGRLNVDVPSRIARLLIAPALPELLRRHPRLQIGLGSSDRTIDLVHEGVDCAVRVGSLHDSSLAVRPIGQLAMVNCASPAYLREHGLPGSVANLVESHLAIGYASRTTGRELAWECADEAGAQAFEVPSRVVVNNAESYMACCLQGLGLIQVPRFDVQQLLAAGELVEVLPGCRALPMKISFVYLHRRQRSRRLIAFMEWFEDLIRPHLV